jgi:hypothetical protein
MALVTFGGSKGSGITVDTTAVMASLKSRSLKGRKEMKLQVGYEAPYAVYVHENLEAYHKPPTRAKYLESPARRLRKKMTEIVLRSVKAKNGLEEGILRAGRVLLDESLKIVPRDTGFLASTGYVRME